MLSSTPPFSAGWPVASSHALLASSRTPSRSAPVMASPFGRNGAGPSLARDGRSPPSLLPTSEGGLCLQSVTVLPAEHRPLPEGGPAHPVLGEPVCRLFLISKGCLLFPWQIKVLFSHGTLWFVSPPPLRGLRKNTAPLLLSSLSRATSWLWRQRKLDSNPHTSGATQWLRFHASTAGGMGLIPGRGSLHAMWNGQKEKRKSTQFLRATSLSSG